MSADTDRVWFDARITPNLAMSQKGLALVAFALLAPALLFSAIMRGGVGCAGVVLCAKRLSEQSERVLLTDNALLVEAWDQGAPSSERVEPTWARIERRMHDDFGCEAVFVRVRVRRRRIRIAQALSTKERLQLADALEHALHQRNFGFAKSAA